MAREPDRVGDMWRIGAASYAEVVAVRDGLIVLWRRGPAICPERLRKMGHARVKCAEVTR